MSAAQHPISAPSPQVAPTPAPDTHEPKSSKKWILWLALLLVGGVAIWYVTKPADVAKPAPVAVSTRTVAATSGNLAKTARVGGVTSAIQFSNVTAPIMRGREANSEMVLLYLAPAGTWVKKGAKVAQIDAQAMQDHIDDLADTIEASQGDIRKRQAEQSIEWENLQQSLRVASASVNKAELDFKASEILTDIQQQLAKLTLDEARASYKQLQADLTEKKKSHAADIRILELTLLRHTQHRDRHRRDIQAFSINASMDGLVVMEQIFRGSEFAQIQVGDRLSPGQRFMKIVNTGNMQVEGSINQAESGNFRVGQSAHIKLDAFKGVEFPGKIYSIGALAVGGFRQSQYLRTVPIRISIEGSHPKLIPDLSASADVMMGSASNQVIVPLAAVEHEDGKPLVHVKTATGFEARPVELGLQNETHVAVATGLKAGEVVRVN